MNDFRRDVRQCFFNLTVKYQLQFKLHHSFAFSFFAKAAAAYEKMALFLLTRRGPFHFLRWSDFDPI